MAPRNDLAPDPGAVFASDLHRRVLAHLSTPSEDIGWEPIALVARIAPDVNTPIPAAPGLSIDFEAEADGLVEILEDLKADGYARRHRNGAWQMTDKGFEAITGPNGNEPPPDAPVEGPAKILGPTPLGGN